MVHRISYSPDTADGGKFFFDSSIPTESEVLLYQRIYRELEFMHHELTGGLTPDGFFVCKNENMIKFIGDKVEARDSFFSHIFPDDIDLVKDFFCMITDQHPEISFDCRTISDTGDIRWVTWRVRACKDVYPIRYLILGHDITDDDRKNGFIEYYNKSINELVQTRNLNLRHIHQKIIEEIARRKKIENTLSALIFEVENEVIILKEVIKNTPDILYVFDLDGYLQYLNSQGAQLLGSPMHSLIGKNKDELALSSEIKDLLSSKNIAALGLTVPLRGVVKNEYCNYDYCLIPLNDNDGITSAILLILFSKVFMKNTPHEMNDSSSLYPFQISQRLSSSVNSLFNTLRNNIALAKR
jgi:PAS domain-containing protein